MSITVRIDFYPYEMREYHYLHLNANDVRRVMGEVHHDMTVDRQAIRYALRLIDYTKNDRPFPGALEPHAQHEEDRLNTTDQDALDKIRQEYLLAEILEAAGNNARDHRRYDVTMQDITNAIRWDDELLTLFRPHASEFASRNGDDDYSSESTSGMTSTPYHTHSNY